MASTIEQAWHALASSAVRPAHVATSVTYPLQLYAQVDAFERPGLLAISDVVPDRPPAYSAFEVTVGHRADGRWAVSLALTQPALRSHFAAMCDKVIELGARQEQSSDACSFLLHQVARWNRMLAIGPDGLLSEEEQRGLLGELVVLEAAADRLGDAAAVDGWVGPDMAPQDFAFNALFVEVKAVVAGTPTISISSLEQLDILDSRLMLAVVELVLCATGTGGVSLRRMVARISQRLESSPPALARLGSQLDKAGYRDREEYDESDYRIVRVRWFDVDHVFPRLPRSRLPLSIVDGSYRILLTSVAEHETDAFANHGRT